MINLAPSRKVRAWRHSSLRFEEYASLGPLMWMLGHPGSHVKQPRLTTITSHDTPDQIRVVTPQSVKVYRVYLRKNGDWSCTNQDRNEQGVKYLFSLKYEVYSKSTEAEAFFIKNSGRNVIMKLLPLAFNPLAIWFRFDSNLHPIWTKFTMSCKTLEPCCSIIKLLTASQISSVYQISSDLLLKKLKRIKFAI